MMGDESLVKFGYAYGGYWCRCNKCGERFDGKKRAWHCRECARAIKNATPDVDVSAIMDAG